MFRTVAALGIVATTLTGFAVAHAKPHAHAYDGNWSVVIVTEKGGCDRSYRYPVRISNGAVGYAGQAGGFTVRGRVAANGSVHVTVSRGNQSANGSGRLAANSGSGKWRGGECSGYWTAEKR